VQNQEQSTSNALWSRLVARNGHQPIDQLYIEYGAHQFQDVVVDQDAEQELYKFVEYIKTNGPRFTDFTEDKLEIFEERIHELRKNQLNNTTGQTV